MVSFFINHNSDRVLLIAEYFGSLEGGVLVFHRVVLIPVWDASRSLNGWKKTVSVWNISRDICCEWGTRLGEGREGTRSAMGMGHTPV